MSPLITGLNDDDVRWSKLKSSYMYNDAYYLRRTKFVIYQCATTSVGICSGLAGPAIHNYKQTRTRTLSLYPNVNVDINTIIAVLALNIAASGLIGTVFPPAIFFDLFWPERWEAPLIQRLWKWSAAMVSLIQVAAAVALTVVMATGHVDLRASQAVEWKGAREIWGDARCEFRDQLVVACVVFSWIGGVFTVWSTVVMWMAYWHNEKHGPFNKRFVKERENGVTVESELANTV